MTMRILAPLHCVFFCSSHSSAQRGGVRHLVIVFCFAPCCHVFFLFQSLKLNRCFICFMMLVRKFVLFCFVVFTTLVDVNLKKKRITGEEEEASIILANGMGGVMNEGGLEGWKMLKHVQANVEDGALALCNVNEEQVQVSVNVGETFTTKLATIEVDLQKTIDMILKQKNVIIASVLEENGHVIKHVEIDVNDIF